MSPTDPGRKPWRRDDPFASFFAQFETEFERVREMMNEMMEAALKAPQPKPGQPFMYGFQVRVGPDGKPHFTQFGDAKALAGRAGLAEPGVREPLCDVLEGEREVSITVELPGVDKESIRLHVAESRVTIEVDEPRRYRKVLDLPAPAKPSSARATYKNGVLDVTLERLAPARPDAGRRIDIE